jgi:aminoglycoside 2'-N-acetyltransferase I
MLVAAFGTADDERFGDDDWDHALGGTHVMLELDGEVVSHAAVVDRELHVAGRPLRTGYVEAVATTPARQGLGLGSLVMTDVGALIRKTFELGALGTGRHAFYERLGWRTWDGPSAVRTGDGIRRTPDEDGFILVLLTATTPELDFGAEISCEWRPGDVW